MARGEGALNCCTAPGVDVKPRLTDMYACMHGYITLSTRTSTCCVTQQVCVWCRYDHQAGHGVNRDAGGRGVLPLGRKHGCSEPKGLAGRNMHWPLRRRRRLEGSAYVWMYVCMMT